jgi:hypothetical protein
MLPAVRSKNFNGLPIGALDRRERPMPIPRTRTKFLRAGLADFGEGYRELQIDEAILLSSSETVFWVVVQFGFRTRYYPSMRKSVARSLLKQAGRP